MPRGSGVRVARAHWPRPYVMPIFGGPTRRAPDGCRTGARSRFPCSAWGPTSRAGSLRVGLASGDRRQHGRFASDKVPSSARPQPACEDLRVSRIVDPRPLVQQHLNEIDAEFRLGLEAVDRQVAEAGTRAGRRVAKRSRRSLKREHRRARREAQTLLSTPVAWITRPRR